MSKTIDPYIHHCPSCEWVGWFHCVNKLGNIYICRKDSDNSSIIIRWSSEPGDYQSFGIGMVEKGSIGIGDGVLIDSPKEGQSMNHEELLQQLRAYHADLQAEVVRLAKVADEAEARHETAITRLESVYATIEDLELALKNDSKTT